MVFAFIAYCKRNNLIRFPGYHAYNGSSGSISGTLGDMSENDVLDYLFDKNTRAYDAAKLANSLKKQDNWLDHLND